MYLVQVRTTKTLYVLHTLRPLEKYFRSVCKLKTKRKGTKKNCVLVPVHGSVRQAEAGPMVSLPEGEFGVSPGQACVLYDGAGSGARVLGGGFIARS